MAPPATSCFSFMVLHLSIENVWNTCPPTVSEAKSPAYESAVTGACIAFSLPWIAFAIVLAQPLWPGHHVFMRMGNDLGAIGIQCDTGGYFDDLSRVERRIEARLQKPIDVKKAPRGS